MAKFNLIKRGYDPVEVDEYLQNLEEIIKGYKEKDSAIKNAILNAQLAADNIIKNAKLEAVECRKNAVNQIDSIIASVSMQRGMLESFRKEYNEMLEKYLQKISEDSIGRIGERIDALEKYLMQFSSDSIEDGNNNG